jgi:hypothetical protein
MSAAAFRVRNASPLAVPEPSAILGAGVAAAALGGCLVRRRFLQ